MVAMTIVADAELEALITIAWKATRRVAELFAEHLASGIEDGLGGRRLGAERWWGERLPGDYDEQCGEHGSWGGRGGRGV